MRAVSRGGLARRKIVESRTPDRRLSRDELAGRGAGTAPGTTTEPDEYGAPPGGGGALPVGERRPVSGGSGV